MARNKCEECGGTYGRHISCTQHPELAALREQVKQRDAEIERLKAGSQETRWLTIEAEAKLAAKDAEIARLRQVVRQADEYIPEVEAKLAAAEVYLEQILRDTIESNYYSGWWEEVRDFLADPATAEIVQRTQEALQVVRDIADWHLEGHACADALSMIGRAKQALLADEPVGGDDV